MHETAYAMRYVFTIINLCLCLSNLYHHLAFHKANTQMIGAIRNGVLRNPTPFRDKANYCAFRYIENSLGRKERNDCLSDESILREQTVRDY